MPTYLYCGINIGSNIPIPELCRSNDHRTEFLFSLELPRRQSSKTRWSYHWSAPGGEKLLSYRKQDSCHWLQFPALADFQISEYTKEISCYPLPDIPQETIRHLLLDQVLPRCLAHQLKMMLHASAIRLAQGMLLFIGESGAGKSTLAGNFHQAGNPALSDDCVWIKEGKGQVVAVPSYGGLRLWEDSLEALFAQKQETHLMAHYSAKKRVPLHENDREQSGTGLPVLGVIVLSPPDQRSASEIILERLSHREAFITMLKQTFQLDLTNLGRTASHAQALGRIVPMLKSFRLSIPRDYDLLPSVRQKIIRVVRS